MELNKILQDIKVVELASVLAGPLAGSFLAELGAEVIKIENAPSGGDVTRGWKLPEESDDFAAGAYYHSANYGKKILMLDLKKKDDRDKLYQHTDSADVILTNYQKHTALKLEVDIDLLRKNNPKAIVVQLNAFEYDDPRPGYDLVMQAETGYISMCGEEGALAKMPVAMIDILAAHQIKEAILLGLMQRFRTGEGAVFHVSLYKAALSGLVNQATNYLMAGHIAKPLGTLHPNIAPYGEILECKDGTKLMLAVGSDGQFSKLSDSLGLSRQWLARYETNLQRVVSRADLIRDIQEQAVKFSGDDLTKQLDQWQIPYAKVKNMKEVLDDPQSQAMILNNPIISRPDGQYISNLAFTGLFFKSNESH